MFELTNKPTNNVTVSHCCSLLVECLSKSLIVQHLAYIVSPARDEQKTCLRGAFAALASALCRGSLCCGDDFRRRHDGGPT